MIVREHTDLLSDWPLTSLCIKTAGKHIHVKCYHSELATAETGLAWPDILYKQVWSDWGFWTHLWQMRGDRRRGQAHSWCTTRCRLATLISSSHWPLPLAVIGWYCWMWGATVLARGHRGGDGVVCATTGRTIGFVSTCKTVTGLS